MRAGGAESLRRAEEADYPGRGEVVEHRVLSVRHSGTRTLLERLAITANNWHFGVNDDQIDEFNGQAHIPVRDPYAVSKSWQERYGDNPRRFLIEFDDWDRLIAYSGRPNAVLYRIESIPMRIGADDPPGNKPYPMSDEQFRRTERFSHLLEWIPDRLPFFRRFYPELVWL